MGTIKGVSLTRTSSSSTDSSMVHSLMVEVMEVKVVDTIEMTDTYDRRRDARNKPIL